MKKIVATFLLFYFLIPFSNAQFNNLRVGIQWSPTLSSIKTDNNRINSNGSNFGVKFGTILEWYLSESFSVNSGLNFSFNEGGKVLYDFGGNLLSDAELSSENLYMLPDGVNIKFNIQYIEIPFSLKLRTKEKNKLRYYANLPMFNVAFRTRARANLQGLDVNVEKEIVNKHISFFNISYGIGAGTEYSLNEDLSLQIGLHFMKGIFDITGNNGVQSIQEGGVILTKKEDSIARLSSINLRLAILF